MTSPQPIRILAIDPGRQYLGIAILEDEVLVRYAVKTFLGRKGLPALRTQVQQYLTAIATKYQPTIVVVEEPFYAQSLLSRGLCKLTEAIKTWARWKGLKVYSYHPPEVKAFFCRDRKNKESLAEAMVERYPFLRRYLTYLPWRRRYLLLQKKKCRNCGKLNHKGVLFCWLCGCSFNLRICASGHKNPAWVQYCLTCGKDRSLMSRPHTTKELSFTPHPTKPRTWVPKRTPLDRTLPWLAISLGAAILLSLAFLLATSQ